MSTSPEDMSDLLDSSGYSLQVDPGSLAAALQGLGANQVAGSATASQAPDFLSRLGALPSNPLFQMGAGLMAAGGPSSTPVGLGQALMSGASFAQQSSEQAAQRNLQRMKLQMALAKMREMQGS